jgi:luciferase family oxidoreductase group 1
MQGNSRNHARQLKQPCEATQRRGRTCGNLCGVGGVATHVTSPAPTSPSVRPLSLLDFVDIPSGLSASEAIARTVRTAQRADELGFKRFWISEHHNFEGLASSSPEILINHVANATQDIRVGAAGIMLPNHAPLKVAEWFKTLEMLHPGRIDLGLGRAPGTDQVTAFALRRSHESAGGVPDFPQQAAELIAFLTDAWPEDHPFAAVRATPVVPTQPELLMLGSSGWGSAFAAVNGMTSVFAHHMSPELAVDALRAYRRDFRPSELGAEPRVIVSALALASHDPDVVADFQAGWSLQMSRIRRGQKTRPTADEIRAYRLSAEYAQLAPTLEGRVFAGEPDAVARGLAALADEAGADELTLVCPTPDHEAKLASLELLAKEWGLTPRNTA